MPRYINNPVPQSDGDAETRRAAWEEFFRLTSRLEYLEDIISSLVPAGYGGGEQIATVASFNIPATTYITVPIDTLSPAIQRGMVADIATDTYKIEIPGVWRFNALLNIENITEVNSSRTFIWRIYNVTDSAVIASVVVPVSRNQGDILTNISAVEDVTDALVGKTLRIEVGGVDAISNGTLVNASIQGNYINEFGLLE